MTYDMTVGLPVVGCCTATPK